MTEKVSLGAKTIAFPAPVFVVASYDKNGKANAMTASWGGICCSKPPCMAVSLRQATYTHGNILERKAFTINIPSADYAQIADYLGIASGRNEDKFSVCGLTPVKSLLVDAPLVEEFPLSIECSLLKVVEIGLHTQFIGEIKDVKIDQAMLNAEGKPDISKIRPFSFAPELREYYETGNFIGKAFSIGKDMKKKG